MKKEKKMFGITFAGDVTINGPFMDIHDNEHVHFHNERRKRDWEKDEYDDEEEEEGKVLQPQTVSPSSAADRLPEAIVAVQSLMWGASSYAVLFCEGRDHQHYPNNMSQFERDVDGIAEAKGLDWRCREGTIADAFRNNKYMKMNVEKWEANGASKRVLTLLGAFQKAISAPKTP